jgi:AAA domain/CHC2 zinc finger
MTAVDVWIEQARSVLLEDELTRRGIHLRGKIERAGPCPVCGGTDRFSINTEKQVWNCRGCSKGGDVIDLVQHIDGVDFTAAATMLAGERPQAKPNGKPNGKDEDTVKLTKVVAGSWRYEDEAGELLFEVKRIEYRKPDGSFVLKNGKREKKFFPYRLDPLTGKGVWKLIIDGVPDVRVVPYRLPELIECIGNGYTVLIVEGEAKVDFLRSWNVPATCCAGGAGKWTAEHSEFLRGAEVVILPDNDEAGRKHCDVVGASLQGIAASVSVLELPNLPPKGDIIDWAAAGGTVEQLRKCEEKPWEPRSEADSEPESETAEHDFPLISFENIVLDTGRRGYLVKGLLPRSGLVVIWGPPKCGKSFWATDIGLHIAMDWEYRGRRVQQATVVYIALEGRHGFPARIEGFKQHHDVQSAPFHLITKPLDLVRKAEALISSIEAQLGKEGRPGVVFLDTLNRSLAGSESKDEDMAAYLAAAGKIEEKFGCLVVIVHHCGIDATRPRGHTSLSGAVEVQIAVKRGAAGEVIATVELAKDMEEGAEIFSTPRSRRSRHRPRRRPHHVAGGAAGGSNGQG